MRAYAVSSLLLLLLVVAEVMAGRLDFLTSMATQQSIKPEDTIKYTPPGTDIRYPTPSPVIAESTAPNHMRVVKHSSPVRYKLKPYVRYKLKPYFQGSHANVPVVTLPPTQVNLKREIVNEMQQAGGIVKESDETPQQKMSRIKAEIKKLLQLKKMRDSAPIKPPPKLKKHWALPTPVLPTPFPQYTMSFIPTTPAPVPKSHASQTQASPEQQALNEPSSKSTKAWKVMKEVRGDCPVGSSVGHLCHIYTLSLAEFSCKMTTGCLFFAWSGGSGVFSQCSWMCKVIPRSLYSTPDQAWISVVRTDGESLPTIPQVIHSDGGQDREKVGIAQVSYSTVGIAQVSYK
jgi:hypothetical protein